MGDSSQRPDVSLALRILEGEENDPAQLAARAIHELAQRLKKAREFSYARRLYERACEKPIANRELAKAMRQQHALCTYKDPDRAHEEGLHEALRILDSDPADRLADTCDQETLGIAGAIHKGLWEADGRLSHLYDSLAFYRRGLDQGPENDDGYTGINAAYLLDLIAAAEEDHPSGAPSREHTAAERRGEADRIRQRILDVHLPRFERPERSGLEGDWWLLVTIAEAYFGLRRYDEALQWLRRGLATKPEGWMLETTSRQLACIARNQGDAGPALEALRAFLGEKADGALTAYVGKVGLALSGGGFRASLFHIGVLAKLAELDLLRHVEVISCVSGGSIIGAHYYLELRRVLAGTKQVDLDRKAYVELVRKVKDDFLAGVQSDIRNDIFKSPVAVAKMIGVNGYNSTVRIGELCEERLYSRVKDGEEDRPRSFKSLLIRPADGPDDFHPKHDNWWRSAKVPILIVNATTLNTGHTWQFTASWMGEPPVQIDARIDGNYRLRRMYLATEVPPPHDGIRLGHAVAASASIPGLFRPLTLKQLYPGVTVRLVDGGVRDNQGILSLLEQDCNITIVSDASGQMDSEDNPSWLRTGVPLRSNSILMATVRTLLFRELETLRRSSRMRELLYVHLKRDLEGDERRCRPRGRRAGSPDEKGENHEPTPYGIPRPVQRALAAMRTDLDSFSTHEAHALMLSGYKMTEKYLPKSISSLPIHGEGPADWDFLDLEHKLDPKAPEYDAILRELQVGSHRFFRGIRLNGVRATLANAWQRMSVLWSRGAAADG